MKKRLLAVLMSGAMVISSLSLPGTAMTALAAESEEVQSGETEESNDPAPAEVPAEDAGTGEEEVPVEAPEESPEEGASEGTSEETPAPESPEEAATEATTLPEEPEEASTEATTLPVEPAEDAPQTAFTVIYDANGGVFADGQTQVTTSVAAGDAIAEIPEAPGSEGFAFTGWYYDAEATEAAEPEEFVPVEDITYYAGWETAVETEAKVEGNGVYQIYYSYQIGSDSPVNVGNTNKTTALSDAERIAAANVKVTSGDAIQLVSYVRAGATSASAKAGTLESFASQYNLTQKFTSSDAKVAKVDASGLVTVVGEGTAVICIQVLQMGTELGRLELTVYVTPDDKAYELQLTGDTVTVNPYKTKGGLFGLVKECKSKGSILKKSSFSSIGIYKDAAAKTPASEFSIANATDEDNKEVNTDKSDAGYFILNATDAAKSGTYYLRAVLNGTEYILKMKVTVEKTLPKVTTKFFSMSKEKTNAFLTGFLQSLEFDVDGATISKAELIPTGKSGFYKFENDTVIGSSKGEFVIYPDLSSRVQNEFNTACNGGDATGKTQFNEAGKTFTLRLTLDGYKDPVDTKVTLPATYTTGSVRLRTTTYKVVYGQSDAIEIEPIVKDPGNSKESNLSEGACYAVYDTTDKTCLTSGTIESDQIRIAVPVDTFTSSRTLSVYVIQPGWTGFVKTSVKVTTQYSKTAKKNKEGYYFTDTIYNIATGRTEQSGYLYDANGQRYTNVAQKNIGPYTYRMNFLVPGIAVRVLSGGSLQIAERIGVARAGSHTYQTALYHSSGSTGSVFAVVPIKVTRINEKASFEADDKQVTLQKKFADSATTATIDTYIRQPVKKTHEFWMSGIHVTIKNSQGQQVGSYSVGSYATSVSGVNATLPQVLVNSSATDILDGRYIALTNKVTANTKTGTYKITVTPYNSTNYGCDDYWNGNTKVYTKDQNSVTYTLVVQDGAVSVKSAVSGSIDLAKRDVNHGAKVTLTTQDTSVYITKASTDDSIGWWTQKNGSTFNLVLFANPSSTKAMTTGTQDVKIKLTMSNGTTQTVTVPVKFINSKSTIKDSLTQHSVSMSMTRISFSGKLILGGSEGTIDSITAASTNKTPFEVKDNGNGSYYIYANYKSKLKKGTYTVPLAVHTTYDSTEKKNGAYVYTTTVNVKVVVK